MGFDTDHVLLIYPVGNSDLNLDAQRLLRGMSFRDVIADVSAEVDATSARVPAVTLRADGTLRTPSFPIVDVVLASIRRQHPGLPIRVRFVVTNQPSIYPSDTVGFDRLVARWLASPDGRATHGDNITVDDPIEITVNPSSFDAMANVFADLVTTIEPDIAEARIRYYTAGTGTPAMMFGAATAFGPDARVIFLYKPDSSQLGVERIEQFRRLPRERTLKLLDTGIARFDLPLARRLLEESGNGFDSTHRTMQDARGRLSVLESWHAELYGEAAERARIANLTVETSIAYSLSARLRTIPTDPSIWSQFWQTKLVDIAARLQIARVQRDVPGFIARLRHFLDVSLLFGLCRYRLVNEKHGKTLAVNTDVQIALQREYNWWPGSFQEEYVRVPLLMWHVRHAAAGIDEQTLMARWLDRYLLLRYFAGDKLREFRNHYVHSTAEFERETLDHFVTELCGSALPHLSPGQGMIFAVNMVVETLNAAPSEEMVAVDSLLGECLRIPERVAIGYQLPIPPESTTIRHLLTMPSEQERADYHTFERLIRQRYDKRVKNKLGALKKEMTDAQRQLEQSLELAITQPMTAGITDRLAALQEDIRAVPHDILREVAEVEAIGIYVRSELNAWLKRRVLTTALGPESDHESTERFVSVFAIADDVERSSRIIELFT